jgi:GTP cyclohydrolase IA
MEIISTAAQDVADTIDPLRGVESLLVTLGEDPTRDGLRDTPKRVVKAYKEMTRGYQQDPKEILSRCFDIDTDELVILKNIEFSSLCEHHLLPFVGTATVGYIPAGKVVGISKLARLVDCFANRLQVQERLTRQIAAALIEVLQPAGVAVLVDAHHQCMGCRGVKRPRASMITSCMLGRFREDPKARAEFLSLIK